MTAFRHGTRTGVIYVSRLGEMPEAGTDPVPWDELRRQRQAVAESQRDYGS